MNIIKMCLNGRVYNMLLHEEVNEIKTNMK